LFALTGSAKRQAVAELGRAESALAQRWLAASTAALDRRAAELVATAQDRDVFGGRRGLTAVERTLLRRVRASRRAPRAASRGLAHLPDLAVAFVERALELTAPGGTAALLVPAKLTTSGYAAVLRRRLARGTRLERVAPIPPSDGAFAAAVYPLALIATRME